MQNLKLFGRSNDSNKRKRELKLTDQYWQRLGELADAKRLDRAAYLEYYVDDLEKEKEALRVLVTGMQEMAIQDQEYIRELTHELDQLEYEEETLDQQEQEFHDETTALQQKIQQLEIENTALQQQAQKLNAEKTILPEKIQKLDLEKTALQQKVQTLELENKNLQKPSQTSELEDPSLSEKVQKLDLERTALQQKLQTLELENKNLQQKVQTLELENKNLQKPSQTKEQETMPSQVLERPPEQTAQPEPAETAPKQTNGTATKTTGTLLQKSIGVVLSFVILFLVGGFTLPSTVHVERSLHIDSKPADIFPLVGNLNEWQKWSPWAKEDPDMEMEITGSGEGQILQWHSNVPTIGNGTQEITESSPPTYVKSHLDFGEQGVADAAFLLEAEDEGTQVSWIFDADMREGVPLIKQPISTYFVFFMDNLIGTKYETGLNQIKTLAEQETPQPTHFLGWTPGERNFVKKSSALFRKRAPKNAEAEGDATANVEDYAGESKSPG